MNYYKQRLTLKFVKKIMKNILLILFLCGFIIGCSSNNNSESGKNSVADYPVVEEFDSADNVIEKPEHEILI